jgi:hypothetical protein
LTPRNLIGQSADVSVETVSVDAAGEILGCRRTRVFELLAAGVLERAPRFGRAIRIFRASVDKALLGASADGGRKRKRRSALPEACSLDDFRHLIR